MLNNELPDGWRWVTLGDIADPDGRAIVSGPFGSNIGSRFFVEQGVPVIRGNNLTTDMKRFVDDGFVFVTNEKADELGNCEAFPDDLIFTAAGSLGQVGIIPRTSRFPRYIISNKQLRARLDKRNVDPLFAFYWFASPQMVEYVQQRNTGSSVPLINLSVLRSLPMPLPSLPEQRVIAGVLGALDDKIELNRRMNETLEALAQAEFGRLKDEGGGMKAIGELAEINSWTLSKNDELGRIEYIEISEVSRGNIGNVQVFQRGEEPSRARRRLRHGDTVLSTVRPERGSYFLCLHPSPNLIASTGFAVVTPTKAPWSFIHAALTQPEVSEHLGHQADGGAYPAVSPEIIGKWEVPWPDDAGTVEEFHQKCAPLYERAQQNRRESQTLAVLRDALLPKLLSGEVRVKETERLAKGKDIL